MSQLRDIWGPIGQLGYVVTDLEAAARSWTETIGCGPWYLTEHASFTEFFYNGVPSDVDVGIALGFMGDVQIELMQQHNDAPSMYRELLDTYGEGAQHICFYPDRIGPAIDAGVQAGMTVGQNGSIWGVEFAYLRGDAGRVIELAELPAAMRAGREQTIADSAAWDGTDPIRSLDR